MLVKPSWGCQCFRAHREANGRHFHAFPKCLRCGEEIYFWKSLRFYMHDVKVRSARSVIDARLARLVELDVSNSNDSQNLQWDQCIAFRWSVRVTLFVDVMEKRRNKRPLVF